MAHMINTISTFIVWLAASVDVENAKIYIENPTAKTFDLDLLYDFIHGDLRHSTICHRKNL